MQRLSLESPELVERMDYVVELLGLGSREELVVFAVRRYVDKYFILNPGLSRRRSGS